MLPLIFIYFSHNLLTYLADSIDCYFIRIWLNSHTIQFGLKNGGVVALAPGASFGSSKWWPVANYARVGDALSRRGARVVPATGVFTNARVETVARIEDPKQQRKLMSIILDDVQRLDRLISDISDASRLDAELSRAHTQPVDLVRLLSALTEAHQATADEGGPKLRFETRGSGSLVVQGIEERLGQVLRNLINNAATFSPPGGTIELAAWREASWAVISVSDSGPGIPESALGAIFDRFYTERPKTEKFGTHSGLGLSISRQIVEAHGGSIRAENRHDGTGAAIGARLVIRLPLD